MDQQRVNPMVFSAAPSITPMALGVALVIAALCFGAGYVIGGRAGRASIERAVLNEVFGSALNGGTFSGRITEVVNASGDKRLAIEAPSMYGVNLPLAYRRKVVHITGATVMTARRSKSPETFNREVEAFRQQPGSQSGPPLPYVEGAITVDNLRVGYQATVNFAPQEGLTVLDREFTATRIDVTH